MRLTEKGEKIKKKNVVVSASETSRLDSSQRPIYSLILNAVFLFTAIVLIQALTASLHVNKKTFTSTKSHQTGFEVV